MSPGRPPRKSPPADDGLRELVREFIGKLLKLPASQRPKARVLRMIQAQLPPFRGRPADPVIQRALKLRGQNLKTDQICRLINLEYSNWSPGRRASYRRNLKRNISYWLRQRLTKPTS